MAYDPLGRLFQVSGGAGVTQFLHDGDELVAEYDGWGNLLRRYVHGDADDDPLFWFEGAGLSQPRFPHADRQGSIVAVAGANGAIHAINNYDEHGIPGTVNSGRFQYTGQAWLPELGLYYYKARIYSPTLGRLLQVDPIGYDGGINLYAYAKADPLNYVDPSGNHPLAIPVALGVRCVLNAACRAAVASGVRAAGRYILPIRIVPPTLPKDESEPSAPESPDIAPEELTGKSRDEIRRLADEKGLKPDPKKPDKFRDLVTGKERIRIDPGHIDRHTGKPYDNPNAAKDHVHGYKPDGTKIADPKTKDPHFPIK